MAKIRKLLNSGVVFLLTGSLALAQAPPVPCPYSDLYTTLQGQIATFDSVVSTQWNGSRPPVAFAGELLKANGNLGRQLLGTGAYNNALLELTQLQSLGVKAVTVNIGFPILLPSFFQWNGDPNDYSAFLNFYKQLGAEIHRRGLQMVVKSNVLFTPNYAPWACDPPVTGFNLTGYYPTLTNSQYMYNRAQVILNIAQQIKPDYISIATEPGTEASITGKSYFSSPSGYAVLINYVLGQLSAAGVTGVSLGAGFGTWLAQGPSYLQALGATSLNYIDLHVYPVNFNWLNNTISLINQAQSLGKQVGISEAWLEKERDSEFGTITAMNDCTIFSRDAFSFWAPVDQQFLNAMVKLSYWKQIQFLSPFWTKYFYTYLDYNQVSGLTPQQLFTQSDTASQTAMNAGQFTSTALAYQTVIGNAPGVDFQLYAGPSCQSAVPGGSTGYVVNAAYSGFTGTVNLSASGLPAGASASFSTGSLVPGSASATLKVLAGAATPPGTYVVTITGTSGSVVHQAPVSFTVAGP